MVRWLVALALWGSIVRAWQSQCEGFTLNHTGVEVVNARYYPVGSELNFTDSGGAIWDPAQRLSAVRVSLRITTNSTANSSANSEVFLPDDWNARVLGTGNGGLNGMLDYATMTFDGMARRYASFGTDTGHQSDANTGTWALHNDNAIVDYTYRAFHLTVQAAKNVVQAYYGRAGSRSYYLSCSTGGRQGLREAQQYPEDFDGVVVGAPANYMAALQAFGIHVGQELLPNTSSRYISETTWSVIHDEVLRQCDMIDGVKDGVLTDPRDCHPASVSKVQKSRVKSVRVQAVPGTTNTTACLNADQINALNNIYRDYVLGNDTFVFAPLEPGGEALYYGTYADVFFPIATSYYDNFVLKWVISPNGSHGTRRMRIGTNGGVSSDKDSTTGFNYSNFGYEQYQQALDIDPGYGIHPPIRYLYCNGTHAPQPGRVVHTQHHRLRFARREDPAIDPIIPPGQSIRYFESVQAFTKTQTEMDPDDFYRLFMVPGMGHCGGGPGAAAFGNSGQRPLNPPSSDDPTHDVLSAMVEWVENGLAPSEIIGTKWVNDNVSHGEAFSRKLCSYPLTAFYDGGNQTSADSFHCGLTRW
ncbi:hypothetical protein EHS25_002190 [Saitozyma podzolica]|uniref:Carboxylic ester hydrolase n=1 Tax=Saitozyma podzolica TaxID=1890683 RepID=A0A427YEN9_9TREE|nr:hypothetical protein EHS25_002190 [Saitozyma podzolica]